MDRDLAKNAMLYCEPLKVKVGATTTTFGINGTSGNAFDTMTLAMVNAIYTANGSIAANPTAGPNPDTGDASSGAALVLMVAAVGTTLALRIRK